MFWALCSCVLYVSRNFWFDLFFCRFPPWCAAPASWSAQRWYIFFPGRRSVLPGRIPYIVCVCRLKRNVSSRVVIYRREVHPLVEMLLHRYLLEDVINRLENATDVSNARLVCKSFRDAGSRVRSLRIVCLIEYHDLARGDRSGNVSVDKCSGAIEVSSVTDRGAKGKAKDMAESTSTNPPGNVGPFFFKNSVVETLRWTECVSQLRIEIEAKLQSKIVPESERRKTDFWLSDPLHVKNWVGSVKSTLQHLCIVDYGQQAIMRRTTILTILSQNCKLLKTLDLRNMFVETTGCEDMPQMTSCTLRCVKVNASALQDINDRMRNLQTLALLGVFGVGEAHLTGQELKVLCLGLSTVASSITCDLPSLVKLQLKMQCPEKLNIDAASLKFIAFNLEVRDCSIVELKNMCRLQELLYGASWFGTLSKLVTRNPNLDKLFLDIPCMALGEDGRWLGVLKDIPLNLPNFSRLYTECPKLVILNIGPGLWHSFEENVDDLKLVVKWPPVRRLILHMIPHSLETCVDIIQLFMRSLQSTLESLQIHVHTNSPIEFGSINDSILNLRSQVQLRPDFQYTPKSWTKSLDFSCFSF